MNQTKHRLKGMREKKETYETFDFGRGGVIRAKHIR